MAKKIFEYPLIGGKLDPVGGASFDLELPSGAIPRRVGLQNNIPTLWAEIDTVQELIPFRFMIVGTGRDVPHGYPYIGSYDEGPFVWHVYGPVVMGKQT